MGTIELVLAMLAAVVASGLVVRMLPIAVPVPLVQIGLGALVAGVTDDAVRLQPDIFFLLFLPPLLFLDGWRIPKERLLRDKGLILGLALGLVFLTVLGMGLFLHWLIPSMPMPVAFALAAIVSPTDPVAVSAITNRVAMPRRLQHVLEGESLLNDASGLVCFRFAVAAAVTGSFSLPAASLAFVQLAIGGIVVGAVLTIAVIRAKNAFNSHFGEESGSQVLISLLLPFAAYQVAEHLRCSGILAAVAAGVAMSYLEMSGRALSSTRMQRTAVWDTLQFALNGIMFVLLGEQLPDILDRSISVVREADHHNPLWLVVYVLSINVGLAAIRFAWVLGTLKVNALRARLRGEMPGAPPQPRVIAAASVAGVRGAITLAGVLTLPLTLADQTPFPARDLTIFLAAGVIIVSLLTANVFLPRLLRGLHIPAETAEQVSVDRARVAAAEAGIAAIRGRIDAQAGSAGDTELYTEVAARVMDQYRRRIDGRTQPDETAARIRRGDQIERDIRLAGLHAERDRIFALTRAQQVSDEAARHLVREIDLMEERLK